MRQTKTKQYNKHTYIPSVALIIGAHCNSDDRRDRCLELLKRCKERYPKYLIIFCSHLPIHNEFYEYIDYAVYNKNNPSVNYDIVDDYTQSRIFGIYQPLRKPAQYIQKPVQTSDYSHYLQVYDGLSIAIKQNIKAVHYFSYDVPFDVLDRIDEHNLYLLEYDGVMYEFANKDYISSEFFSILVDVADKTIGQVLSFDEYKKAGSGDFGHETIYHNLFKNYNFKNLGFYHRDGRDKPWIIGDFSTLPIHTNEQNISRLPSKIDGVIVIPYKTRDKKERHLALNNGWYEENEGVLKDLTIEFYDETFASIKTEENKNLGTGYWCEFEIPTEARYVKLFFETIPRILFDLEDEQNYGRLEYY